MRIFLDIETIPAQADAIIEEMDADLVEKLESVDQEIEAKKANVKAPSNYKDAAKIEEHERQQMEKLEKERQERREKLYTEAVEQYRKTALSGDRGEVAAIGWAVNDSPIHVAHRGLNEPESEVLANFFDAINQQANQPGKPATPQWVGHNVKDFDLRFIWQRAVINGIRPTVPLPHDARPGSSEIFDTMTAWAGFGNRISLDRLCTALGIPGKNGMDGSMVWDYIRDGNEDEVAEYCRADVERTRQVFHRLTFGNFQTGKEAYNYPFLA